jgi:hypothetical protein
MTSNARLMNAAAGVALTMILSVPVVAHETMQAGNMRLTVGWGDEPTFSGLKNSVDVDIVDRQGSPVVDPEGSLSAQVRFGDEQVTLALSPSRGRPGRYTASLVPTRPGTYTFHITGKVKGQEIHLTSTCGEMTFSCVGDVSEIQFPAKDPSTGQLADRISRTLPRAERAMDTAADARLAGMLSASVAGLALAVTLVATGRRRRKEV